MSVHAIYVLSMAIIVIYIISHISIHKRRNICICMCMCVHLCLYRMRAYIHFHGKLHQDINGHNSGTQLNGSCTYKKYQWPILEAPLFPSKMLCTTQRMVETP